MRSRVFGFTCWTPQRSRTESAAYSQGRTTLVYRPNRVFGTDRVTMFLEPK